MSQEQQIAIEERFARVFNDKSFKERLSGVSLDEEAANMVRYQNAYEASAKVIKASDEMFKAVLGLMG